MRRGPLLVAATGLFALVGGFGPGGPVAAATDRPAASTAPPAGIEMACPPGYLADGHGGCKRSPAQPRPKCPPGQSPDRSGRCVPSNNQGRK
jgi:hypothetical protein